MQTTRAFSQNTSKRSGLKDRRRCKVDKNLATLAREMQVLKAEDKEDFLGQMKDCAILFNPKEPRSVPLCPLDERMGYKICLIRSLYRKLEGEPFIQPTDLSRSLADPQKLKQMNEQEIRQRVIFDGVTAYCAAPSQDRFNFEKIVRKSKLFASFLRKKDRVLDYDFI